MNQEMNNQWTVASLYDFFIRLIEANDTRYKQRFEDAKTAVDIAFSAQKESVNSALLAAERAVLKAESASEKRFDSVNEFRNTLADQQRTLMPRAEAEIVFKTLSSRIEEISNFQKITIGEKRGIGDFAAWIVTFISVGVSILLVIKKS